MEKEWTYRQAYSNGEPAGFVVQDGPANPICDVATEKLAQLIAATPQMHTACESADIAFAVLQISDLTPQARGCVREAWPLIQEALAAARPGGVYAEVIKDAHQHEIKRLDGIVGKCLTALQLLLDPMVGMYAHQESLGNKCACLDCTKQKAKAAFKLAQGGAIGPDEPVKYTGPMDPDCYYAKSCGLDPCAGPACKERRQVVGGIYYSDEIGQLGEEKED